MAGLLPKAWVLSRPGPRPEPEPDARGRDALLALLNLLEAVAGLMLRVVGLRPQWDELVPALSAGSWKR